jgi:hypothetical protein
VPEWAHRWYSHVLRRTPNRRRHTISEREQTASQTEDEDHGGDSERPAQHAARHDPGGEEERNPQDETENTTFDTEEHSDAPGPFGTG